MTRNESKRSTAVRETKNAAEKVVPKVYREMLVENSRSSPTYTSDEGHSLKKRRIGGKLVIKTPSPSPSVGKTPAAQQASAADKNANDGLVSRPAIYASESESSAIDEMDWEEVDFVKGTADRAEDFHYGKGEAEAEAGLDLVLGETDTRTPRSRPKKRTITPSEKKLRLEIHKMHVLCLMMHVGLRNHWCNDVVVQRSLRQLLSKKVLALLNLDESHSQHKRSVAFTEGMQQAALAFQNRFSITARGMSRSTWAESVDAIADLEIPDDLDLPMQRSDFQEAAKSMSASRDVGAQLFCSFLRGVGVDARLCCSLQILPLNQTAAHKQPASSGMPTVSYAHNLMRPEENNSADETTPIGAMSSKKRPRKRIRESSYPVYWVEAFDEAQQKWIAVDPLVTKTIGKPSRLEPPASDFNNHLVYVVAFEDDGSSRDVTQRYAKAFNAKTRKERVESTNGGERWWKSVLKLFRRRQRYDRDQIEDTQLATKQAQEGMPGNVQDFKDHPFYVLERHLKRHEVIRPKREVGKVGVGRVGGEKILEPVFRQQDVLSLKSADKWYRQGREIRRGEQPLKHIISRRPHEKRGHEDDPAESEDNNVLGVGFYSLNQTIQYQPVPVRDGKIPKNVYGNLDIYTPTMIPPGSSHVTHPETRRIAKLLGVDAADAVTGFTFRGKHGTANINGAVVPTDCCEAIEAVLEVLEDHRIEAEAAARSQEALRCWKRFMSALRIQERIQGYQIEGEQEMEPSSDFPINHDTGNDEGPESTSTDDKDSCSDFQATDDDESDAEDGGFLTENATETNRPSLIKDFNVADSSAAFVERIRSARLTSVPYTITHGPPLPTKYDNVATGIPESSAAANSPEPGGFLIDDDAPNPGASAVEERDAGGFYPDPDQAGGFMAEDGAKLSDIVPNDQTAESEDLFEESVKPPKASSPVYVLEKEEREAMQLQEIHDDAQDLSLSLRSTAVQADETLPTAAVTTTSERKASQDTEMREADGDEGEEISPSSHADEEDDALPLEDPDDEDADPEWLV